MWIVGDSKANQACGLKIKRSRDAYFHVSMLFFNVCNKVIRHFTINTRAYPF